LSHSTFPCEHDFQQALSALKRGEIVAYPTETFYGLAVDPENDQAINSLYELKRREAGKPISLLVPNLEVLSTAVRYIPPPYEKLFSQFWPGPLTLVFPAHASVSSMLTAGGDTLAMRISSNPVARHLCELWGKSLTSTSANRSGEKPFVTAGEVQDLWGNQLGCILDGGEVPGGKGSTIVHCSEKEKKCRILRPGVISAKSISQVLPLYDIICKS